MWGICPFHAASALAQRFEKLPWEQFFLEIQNIPLDIPQSWAYCCILAYISLSPTATAHSQWLGSLECPTRRPVQNTILTANDIVREFHGPAPISQPYLQYNIKHDIHDVTWEIPGKWLQGLHERRTWHTWPTRGHDPSAELLRVPPGLL